ncbi:hypothetical protein [Hymenobacter terrenus]|nr:hypothetical protein [Hymenobacter terrenus]
MSLHRPRARLAPGGGFCIHRSYSAVVTTSQGLPVRLLLSN